MDVSWGEVHGDDGEFQMEIVWSCLFTKFGADQVMRVLNIFWQWCCVQQSENELISREGLRRIGIYNEIRVAYRDVVGKT